MEELGSYPRLKFGLDKIEEIFSPKSGPRGLPFNSKKIARTGDRLYFSLNAQESEYFIEAQSCKKSTDRTDRTVATMVLIQKIYIGTDPTKHMGPRRPSGFHIPTSPASSLDFKLVRVGQK